jgi:hypothetical protein
LHALGHKPDHSFSLCQIEVQLGLCKPLAVNLSIAEDAGPGQLVGFLSASTRSAVFVVGRSLHIRVVPPFGLCVETRFVMDFILIFFGCGDPA